jgi:phospholipase/carboxylesterase
VGDRQLPRAEDRLAPDRRLSLHVAERPATGDPAGALVFFHGYNGNENDFPGLLDRLDPDGRFHCYMPRGPMALGEDRAQWFELDRPSEAWARLEPVADWLDALPYAPDRIVLVGWSQGAIAAGALGLAAGRPRPGGVVLIGGSLPFFFAELDLTVPLPPVAIVHGSADEAVPVAAARNGRAMLEAAGAELLYRETPVGHELDEDVVPDLRALLAGLPRSPRG